MNMFELEETLKMGDREISVYSDKNSYRISMTGFPGIGEAPLEIGKDEAITQFIQMYTAEFMFYPVYLLFN